MTNSEIILKATNQAAKVIKVSYVTLQTRYAVEIDQEYMLLSVYYIDTEGAYVNIETETNSRTDGKDYGADLLLYRLENRLTTIQKQTA